ncbi:hypothetical protein ACNOYE_27110 [Nannocystaceae bacterium ST9]
MRVEPEGENLCRRARPGECASDFVIEAQGLPNLVHELVHAIFLGRLEDDHGFDYGLIPLDLAHADQRRHLWEELACCVVSVAYAERFQPPGFRLAWFVEQFEIQGVFHGLESDLAGFRDRVDRAVGRADWAAELEATLAFAFREVGARLLAVGTAAEFAVLNDVPKFDALWREYRRLWDVPE